MATLKEKKKKAKDAWLIAFGNHVKSKREERGLKFSEFAALISMDTANLARLEKGRINPSIYSINQICEALDIKIEEFFKNFR